MKILNAENQDGTCLQPLEKVQQLSSGTKSVLQDS